MFTQIKNHFSEKNMRLYIAGIALVMLGYGAFGYLASPRGAVKAAVVESGYGCYQYGGSSNYGSCQVKLTQGDVAYINSLLTTNGIVCTPAVVEINQTITCTGTLNDTRLPPADTLFIGVQGQTPVSCTFAGQVFTCSGIQVGNTAGAYNLVAYIGNGTPIDTGVDANPINRVFNATDLANGVDPFTTVNCGTNNTVNVGDTVTCTATVKPGFTIPSDFRFGIGTNPGGTCTVSGNTLTCTGIPVSTTAGPQTLKISVGNSAIKDYNKTITVNAGNPGNLARTGGINQTYIIIAVSVLTLAVIVAVIYIIKSKKNKITKK